MVWLRRDADKVSGRVAKVLRKVSELELLQAPNLPYTLPKEYRSLPHLTGMHRPSSVQLLAQPSWWVAALRRSWGWPVTGAADSCCGVVLRIGRGVSSVWWPISCMASQADAALPCGRPGLGNHQRALCTSPSSKEKRRLQPIQS